MALVALMLSTRPARTQGGEAPSWFAYRGGQVEVHVCNELNLSGQAVRLSEFAPRAGAAWAKEHAEGSSYVLPVKTVGLYLGRLSLLVAEVRSGRSYPMRWATWQAVPAYHDTAYVLVAFPESFRLKDVVAFRFQDGARVYALKQESKLN